jgi:hypothetical protein
LIVLDAVGSLPITGRRTEDDRHQRVTIDCAQIDYRLAARKEDVEPRCSGKQRSPDRRPALTSARACCRQYSTSSIRPYVRLAQRRPVSRHARYEGCAGRPAQSLNHGRRTRWILSLTLGLMCTRRRSPLP